MEGMVSKGYKSLFNNLYKNKRVLITGHTGFKGSWLALWLNEMGADVIGYSLDPINDYDNFNLINLSERIIDIRGDIRDEKKLNEVFDKYKPEFVFHLAAQPLVRVSYESPKDTYETNVMGTLNVLECIRKSDSVKVGVMITTDKCYENKEQIWGYRETDPLGGYDPYSSSKGCCEILINSYRSSFMNPDEYKIHGKSISSVRAGNVIGGGDWSKDRIVPDCIKKLMDNEIIELRNPESIRPWQYVLEPLYGYLLLASKMYENGAEFAGAWNFGPNNESVLTVSEVTDLIIKNWGEGAWRSIHQNNMPHEANILKLDITKSREYLGWNPVYNINQCIKDTVKWYKSFNDKNDMYNVSRTLLFNYTDKIIDSEK